MSACYECGHKSEECGGSLFLRLPRFPSTLPETSDKYSWEDLAFRLGRLAGSWAFSGRAATQQEV